MASEQRANGARFLSLSLLLLLLFVSIEITEAKRRVSIPDELDDVVDEEEEEDEDWKQWGQTKNTGDEELKSSQPPIDFSKMSPEEIQAEISRSQTGPSFGFVKLRLGVTRSREDVPLIAMKWSKIVRTGSIEAKFMAVDQNTIMFTMEKGQDTEELKEFILSQPEAYEMKIGNQFHRRPGDPPLDEVKWMERVKITKIDTSVPFTDIVVPPTIPTSSTSSNLREEYANAFRTDSYLHFFSHVLSLSPSSHLLSSSLLSPDQPTATHLLSLHLHPHHHHHHHLLLSSFFSDTSNASLLCSLLLSNLHSLRLSYLSLTSSSTPQPPLPNLSTPLFPIIQESISNLLTTLESKTKQTKSKLRLISRLKKAAALLLIAITASASVIGVYITLHAFLAVIIALPLQSFFPRPRWLRRALAQLDAASRGAYILNRDLDTVSRLVDRLQDEVEHMMGLLRLCLEMAGDRRRMTPEVVRQLRMCDASFNQQLDELQEHLYLCFMTINKARSLVIKELSPNFSLSD
ncbi:hypothetical protein J5N97_023146 [Dioscorea zingiberensis]|uniref:Uncharacterized protein n=1 Tax=Dioscorea zingiberensis TaxID=325984 RepID=A0A9D5CC84_9LILI|nr:hypothetical protein J5N97_023146 [Dioscorea zingiberensis]